MDSTLTSNLENRAKRSKKFKSRATLLAILSLFLIPAFVANFLLNSGAWKSLGSKVQGELVTPPLDLNSLSLSSLKATSASPEHTWTLVFHAPTECTDSCKNALMQMRQVHKALGPNQKRIKRALFYQNSLNSEFNDLLTTTFPNMKRIEVGSANDELATITNDHAFVWLIDPMNQAMLKYPAYENEREAILAGKKILQDLKYLLKVSRIG